MPATVLLVIPDHTVAKYLGRALARDGYACARAATAAEALETIEASGPWAAVVVDLDLIGSHARGRLAELRQAHPSLPIIALDSLSECRGQGEGVEPFDAVVAKPFVLSPLLTLLGQLASRRQQAPSL